MPYGSIRIECENGHYRKFERKAAFRKAGKYFGVFSELAVPPENPRTRRERKLEPSETRRAEILEDAEYCKLCGTPPISHPFRPEQNISTDRQLWDWIQRWRPALNARLSEALQIVRQTHKITYGNWRLKIPSSVREAIIIEMRDSELQVDHLVPVNVLEKLLDVLAEPERTFAVNRLLLALCRKCNNGRWRLKKSREQYLREYVVALYDGDTDQAQRDSTNWRLMEVLAFHASLVAAPGETERT
jgi:hypothetical protein